MAGRKFQLCVIVGALAMTIGGAAMAQPYQVNVSGATLFADFFRSPASTNDSIDCDGDGFSGFSFTPPYVDQLAAQPYTAATWWHVIYRGVGSGNGLAELVSFYNTPPVDGVAEPGKPLQVPAEFGLINRTEWANLGVLLVPPGDPSNPGGSPVPQNNIDIGVMDVPTSWFVKAGNAADAAWNRKPTQSGYGQNAVKSWDKNQSNTLKSLGSLNLNVASPNSQTVFDTEIAWVPIGIIGNAGTGVQDVDFSDLQYLFVTGRTKSGENLVGATRDAGSGTRNGAMNSLGIDPSQGRGDNLGLKHENVDVTQLGPKFYPTNAGGSGIMEDIVRYHRLAIGYTGLAGSSRAEGDAAGGRYEVLNVRKDVAGGTVAVRPTLLNVLRNADINDGWQIGGAETMATVGDPEAPTSGKPAMLNPHAAAYIRNITHSIAAFSGNPNANAEYNMPGEYLATKFMLNAALDALPTATDPTNFVPNASKNATLQAWMLMNNTFALPPFGSVNPSGFAPKRLPNPDFNGDGTVDAYSDGSVNGNYTDAFGNTVTSSTKLSERNKIAGDFNYAGTEKHKRNLNDIAKMMEAVMDPNAFEAGIDHGGYRGTQLTDAVVVEIIGDFNGDGNFDAKDVRYFADGLAIDPGTGKLDRKQGFILVDQAWAALPGGDNNYFNTTLKTNKPYTAGGARGDVAGNPASFKAYPGAYPNGSDGTVDAYDVRYVKANMGTWADLNSASKIDLSCDMNGDLVVNYQDLVELHTSVLGTYMGDITLDGKVNVFDLQKMGAKWNLQKGQAGWDDNAVDADLNGDGRVNVFDLQIMGQNWNRQ